MSEKLPIKVVVDHKVEEPTLMINEADYAKLMDILGSVEHEHEAWKFRRIMEGLAIG